MPSRAKTRACLPLLVFAASALAAPELKADLDFARIVKGLAAGRQRAAALPRALLSSARRDVSLLVERGAASAALPGAAVPINAQWFALSAPSERARELATLPGVTLHWAPERRLLLDQASQWTHVAGFRAMGGGSGRGVAIGIVDSGVDLRHPDLRGPDGATRVKWWIDFTRAPAALQPDLEEKFGCTLDDSCAVFSGSDLDALLRNDVSGDEPRDNIGHGTHVASLAAGNGSSLAPPKYVGVAPDADLIVARVVGSNVGISDATVARAVSFVFERAQALGEPAVANLSLGSDLGAHDGSSALERVLASFVGPEQPGRAIVVAAGNSAGLYRTANSAYPEPFGVHTQVHVPRESPARVPILTPAQGASLTQGRVEVWLSQLPGDALEVGFSRASGPVGRLARPGEALQLHSDDLDVLILNGVDAGNQGIGSRACLVVIDGSWPSGETFALRLGGHGTASLWATGGGDLDPNFSVGPLFPRGQKEGTINVPASSPELIAVGATVNRTEWLDWQGNIISRPENGAIERGVPDSTSYFSSAGPNADGVMKPDIVAPGVFVIGAMASASDPRRALRPTMFSGEELCDGLGECLVVDDYHAVARGTSMAAPLVSGAVALLLEREPSLTQDKLRALLQAGARPLAGAVLVEQQLGVGALDVEGAISALDDPSARPFVAPTRASWVTFAASFAHPDPSSSVLAYLELRDDAGHLADVAASRLAAHVRGGSLAEPLSRIGPGFYRFAVSAPAESGGSALGLTITCDGELIAERSLPIAVDPGALSGPALARGGCAVATPARGGAALQSALALLIVSALRRGRRGRRGARSLDAQ